MHAHPIRQFRKLIALPVASVLLLSACAVPAAAPSAPTSAPAAEAPQATEPPKAEEAKPTEVAKPAETPATEAGGDIVFGLDGDIQKVDPAFAYDFTTNPVVTQITEGVLRFDGNKVVPYLAESVENPDPLTYIYKIRKGVTFHDGSPMTVDDVIFSMERIKDPKNASYVSWMYGSVDKIEKVDDDTVKVTLKQPDALWQYVLATTAGHVVSKKQVEAAKDKFGTPEAGAIGTGPFKFVSWKSGDEIVLEKNDNYWNKANGGPYLDKIIYKILPEATTRVTSLQSGDIGMTFNFPPDQLAVISQMPNVDVQTVDSFLNNYIAFNTQREPFDNVKVRQALNYAVDKDQVVKTYQGELASVAGPVPVGPQMWSFAKNKWEAASAKLPNYARDLDKAKQLLEESGVADKLNGKNISVQDDPVYLGQALALQSAAKELGIDLEIKKMTIQELVALVGGQNGTRDYDMVVAQWGSDFPDPAGNLLPVFHSNNRGAGGSNSGNYQNAEVDKLLDEQNGLIDNDKRAELMIQAQALIANDSPWLMISYPKVFAAVSKDYSGFTLTPLYYWDAFFKDVKKAK